MENLLRRSSRSRFWSAAQDVLALEHDLARGRLDQPGQAAHQGRLARPGQAHHHEHLAGRDVEVDAPNRDRAAGALQQLAPGQRAQLGRTWYPCRLGPEDLPQVPDRDDRLLCIVHPRSAHGTPSCHQESGVKSEKCFLVLGQLAPCR